MLTNNIIVVIHILKGKNEVAKRKPCARLKIHTKKICFGHLNNNDNVINKKLS